MIVCVDTNVFVSGIFWEGSSSKILELWIDNAFEVVVSPEILLEYELVLRRFTKKLPWDELVGWVNFAKSHSRLITSSGWPEAICRDSDDEKFLTTSVAGNVNYLITGDKDLLSIQQKFSFKIIRPAAFINTIRNFI